MADEFLGELVCNGTAQCLPSESTAQAVNRLQTYHNNVSSVLDYYRDILVEVRWLVVLQLRCWPRRIVLHSIKPLDSTIPTFFASAD